MKPINHINESVMKTVLYLALCFVPALVLAETGHGTEEEHEESHIELTHEQIEHAGIGLAQVTSGTIRETLPVYGMVTSNAEQVQSVSARFDGVIRSVSKKIGDQVLKGETLVSVEANESLNDYSVTSSLKGVVTQRNANVGEQTADRVLFVIENFSTVWVDLSLFPKDVGKAQLGQTVRIKNVNHSVSGEGKITYIAPSGNSNSQATSVRVLVQNKDNRWKPGLFVNAEITLSEVVAPLVVSNEAVQIVEGVQVIFVKAEEGFEPRPVSLGRTDGELSEVLSGLNFEETYVSKNSFILKAEMRKEDAEHDD
jgi:cobalt-zinc-cadmium efflux system membrane fusion protein